MKKLVEKTAFSLIMIIFLLGLFYLGGVIIEASFDIFSWNYEIRLPIGGILIGTCFLAVIMIFTLYDN